MTRCWSDKPEWRGIVFVLWSGLCLLLVGCDEAGTDRRAQQAAGESDQSIKVGLVWDFDRKDGFLQGARLATAKINEAGGVLGRQLELIEFDDGFPRGGDGNSRGVDIGREISKNPEIVSVIGHSDAATAVSASIIYEQKGILFINPGIADRSLNDHGFKYVFSTIPNNVQIGTQLATQAFSLGHRRVGILSSRSDDSFEIVEAFAKQAATLGISIVSRQSFFGQRTNFRDILAGFGSASFDALFVAADTGATRSIITQGLEMNLRSPFLLGGLNDPLALKEGLGDKTTLITTPILFNPYTDGWESRRFKREFREAFEVEPDGWAAQGYDAVRMIAHGMKKAKGIVPLSVATIIRYTLSWQGITGRHSFDLSGAIYSKALDFATLEEGLVQFHSAEGGVHTYSPEQK